MKTIVVAMDNSKLLEQIRKTGKYKTHNYDITTKENVIEYLEKNAADVIITKDFLPGDMAKKEYVKQLKRISHNSKIIFCVENINEEYKGFLFANGIFNVIEEDNVNFTEILNLIECKEGRIILKSDKEVKKQTNGKMVNIISRQKVCVFGTSGSGKSYVASIFAHIMSKKFKMDTLLVDMDIQNAASDLYNNLNNPGNNLQFVMEEIDRGSFDAQTLQDLISREKGKKANLSFITNNMGIYECQNKISKEYYSQLYKEIENRYDVLLIDMPSSPFLDVVPYTLTKVDRIFFVINPNFISIRQAIKYLDLLTNIWKIEPSKISIVINKIRKNSLDIRQIKSALKDYDICCCIKDDESVEGVINGLDDLNYENINCDNILKFLNIPIDIIQQRGIGESNGY